MEANKRQLKNEVTLGGFVAMFEKTKEGSNYREGVTKDGIPYISFKGQICCGDNSDSAVRFSTFIRGIKKDGTPSKLYASAKEWVENAVAKCDDLDHATFVEMRGSINDSPYVRKDGELNDTYTEYSITRFYNFKEYKAEVDLEGYISSIVDETVGEEEKETGRKVMRFISKDPYNKTIELNKVYIPEELKRDVKGAGWEDGVTTKIYMNIVPKTITKTNTRTGGFGKAHVDSGSEFTIKEFVVCGGEDAYEDDKAITPEEVRELTQERVDRLNNIKAAGCLGQGEVGTRTSMNGVSNARGFVPKKVQANEENTDTNWNW